ncbi:MAG: VOC family protein [Bacteroidota bacterium]
MSTNRTIDHIVYAVPNLEEAINWFENRSGIRPIIGGKHAKQGTKNALVNLGDACYLELITVDTENTNINTPRWMGVDLLNGQSKTTRWSLKSNDLESDSQIIKAYDPEMGVIHQGQRQTTTGQLLRWQMTLPLAHPQVELVPFMTDWQHSDFHPTDKMEEQCQLLALSLYHPKAASIQPTIDALQLDMKVQQKEQIAIELSLATPKGVVNI